ncbi:universal stress protein [Geomonas oryzae]|uniref:universal stress protein n=1 Tax=Geomonas oryzae TaxID=2364273 RepID=UPI00100BE66A|nr:universal stress protein [Geomonas oryzae]
MFRKMMVCTDLTPASFSLIACAAQLQQIGTKDIVLVHVVESVATAAGTLLSSEEEGVFRRQKEMLEEHGINVAAEVLHGMPASVLDAAAVKHDVRGIVVGSHSKAVIALATLGSVSAALLARTLRPLLLYRVDVAAQGGGEDGCGSLFRHILFPTDFSEASERGLDYLGKIALEQHGAAITLLHVLPKDEDAEDGRTEEDAQYLLEAKKRRLERLRASEVGIELVRGDAAEEVIARGKTGLYSLVVMGCQGKGALKRVMVGSTAEQVTRRIEVPALLVPGEHHVE